MLTQVDSNYRFNFKGVKAKWANAQYNCVNSHLLELMATPTFHVEEMDNEPKTIFMKELQIAIQQEIEAMWAEEAYTLKIRVKKEDGSSKFTITKADENDEDGQSSQKPNDTTNTEKDVNDDFQSPSKRVDAKNMKKRH